MPNVISRSFRMIFGLSKRDRLNRELRSKLVEYDRTFLKMVTDPNYDEGKLNKVYREGIMKIRNWYDIANRKI